jgi:mannose/fructose/sorbose-specific phosphotransferase system IIA component
VIGVIICTHSKLAEGFIQAVEMIMGKQEKLESIGFFSGDNIIELGEKIKNKIKKMNTEQTVIFSDLFGASPSNAAAIAMMEQNAFVITGVNMAMLAEILIQRDNYTNAEELIEQIADMGRDNIRVLTKETINNIKEGRND